MTQVKVGWWVEDHLGHRLIDKEVDKVPADRAVEITTSLFDALEGEGPIHLSPDIKREKEPRKFWADEEIKSIMPARSKDDALRLYFQQFPDSDRTLKAVENAYTRYVLPKLQETTFFCAGCGVEDEATESGPLPYFCEDCGREISKTQTDASLEASEAVLCAECSADDVDWSKVVTMHDPIPVHEEEQDHPSGSEEPTGRGRWLDTEKDILRLSESAKQAVHEYREAFPESERTDSSISAMWYYLKNSGKLIPLKIGQMVILNSPSLPQHGKTGYIIQLKGSEALVSCEGSTIWITRDCLLGVGSSASGK